MDYGDLIRRSWRLTWRNRFLWVLGLFATTTVGSCSPSFGGQAGPRVDEGDLGGLPFDVGMAAEAFGKWVAQNLAIVLLAVGALALIGLALLVVSLIAQGGMASATLDLARGRTTSLGQAWRVGLRLFWRYLLLWLLLIGLSIVIAAAVATYIAIVVFLVMATDGVLQVAVGVVGGLIALVLILVAIPALIGLGIAVAFAQRSIAVEDIGPTQGLGRGIDLVRNNLGTSALAWVISLGLSFAASIGVGLGAILLFVPLGIVGALLYAAVGFTTVLFVYAALAVLAFVAAAWLLGAIANTYFWNYWTLVYLDFADRATAAEAGAA